MFARLAIAMPNICRRGAQHGAVSCTGDCRRIVRQMHHSLQSSTSKRAAPRQILTVPKMNVMMMVDELSAK